MEPEEENIKKSSIYDKKYKLKNNDRINKRNSV